MAKSAQIISQIRPTITDSLISVPQLPNELFSRDTLPELLLPQQRLIKVEPASPRTSKSISVQTRSVKTVQKPRFELNHNDSIKFNLIHNKEAGVDWEMKFDFHTQFNDTAYTRIDPLYLSTDSAQKSVENNISKSISNQNTTSTETRQEHLYNLNLQRDKELVFNQDWLFGLLVFSTFLVGIVKVKYNKYLKDLFVSFLYPSFKENKQMNTNISNRVPSYLLGFLFYFNSALFVFQLSVFLKNPLFGLSGPIVIIVAFFLLLLIFMLKLIVYKIAGTIFGTTSAVNRYLIQSANTSKIFAIIILPFILLITFSTETTITVLYKIVFALFSFLYLMQVGRGIKNNLTSFFSLYYIILYLCALEIVPLTLLFKVLFK